jgi:hypothetical protein
MQVNIREFINTLESHLQSAIEASGLGVGGDVKRDIEHLLAKALNRALLDLVEGTSATKPKAVVTSKQIAPGSQAAKDRAAKAQETRRRNREAAGANSKGTGTEDEQPKQPYVSPEQAAGYQGVGRG